MTECMHLWCVCVYVCVYVWMYVCMFAFMRAGVHICMYVCVCLYVYMCVYMCVYCVYMYLYVYRYRYIHTQNFLLDLLYSISWLFILLCYNPICWCWKASRNIYFEQTQEELFFYIQNTFVYLYICILGFFFRKYKGHLNIHVDVKVTKNINFIIH